MVFLEKERGDFMNILKKLSALIAGLALMFGLVNAGQSRDVETKKALIVYFSHTGNTKLIAEKAKKELIDMNYQVDLQRIEPHKAYPEYGDELRDLAKKESEDDNCRPEFKAIEVDLQSYDLILIGTPVWWYKAPKVILSFLEQQNFSGENVRFFITHAGGPGACLSDMKEACKGAKFGEHIDIYCNSPGNGKVDDSEVAPWIEKIKNKKE